MTKFFTNHSKDLFSNTKEKLYVGAICLVIASLFFPNIVNSAAIGVLVIVWLLNNPFTHFQANLKTSRVALLFMLLYLLHIFGLLYSSNMEYGLKELEYKLSLFVIPLVLVTGPTLNSTKISLFLRVFYFGTIVTIVVAIIHAVMHMPDIDAKPVLSYFTYRDFSRPVGFDPIYLGLFIVFAIFAICAEHIITKGQDAKFKLSAILVLVFVLLITTLVFLSSRMEILVFVTTLLGLVVYFAIKNRTWKIPLLVMIVVPSLMYGLISVNTMNKARFTEMVDLKTDYKENKWGGRSIRIEKWKNAVECWKQSPIIGVGSGDTIDELVKIYQKNEFHIAAEYRFNPHNQYLQTSVALGLVGLIVLVLIFWNLFYLGVKKQDWLLMAFAFITASSMLTESMLERQKGLVFIVIFSMILSLRHQQRKSHVS